MGLAKKQSLGKFKNDKKMLGSNSNILGSGDSLRVTNDISGIDVGSKAVLIYLWWRWAEKETDAKVSNYIERKDFRVFGIITDSNLVHFQGASWQQKARNYYKLKDKDLLKAAINQKNKLYAKFGHQANFFAKVVVTKPLTRSQIDASLNSMHRKKNEWKQIKSFLKYKSAEVFDTPKLIYPKKYTFEDIPKKEPMSKTKQRRLRNKAKKHKHYRRLD